MFNPQVSGSAGQGLSPCVKGHPALVPLLSLHTAYEALAALGETSLWSLWDLKPQAL